MLLCIGDSLTFGSVGYSYLRFMDKKIKTINKGVNGDTTICTYDRLLSYLSNPKYDDADTYLVSIGSNDIITPYLAEISFTWMLDMKPLCALKKCITDDDVFRTEYEKYLQTLSQRGKKIITMGMPYIQLKDFPLDTLKHRNEIIKELSAKYKAPYVDVFALQQSMLSKEPKKCSWKRKKLARVLDAFFMLFLPFSKDWFSKLRRLELSVDGVHFNSASAKIIGNAVSRIVCGESK